MYPTANIYLCFPLSYDCLFASILCNFPLCLGGDKNHSLPLLRMISDTAARINAIEFFEILFRSHVGCTLFRSFKDCQPPLEEIARLNGHTELALMLEEKHLL